MRYWCIMLCVCLIALIGCSSNDNKVVKPKEKFTSFSVENEDTVAKEPKQVIGKYVYMSMQPPCLHVSTSCGMMYDSQSNFNQAALRRIPIDELSPEQIGFCCGICIDDSIYDELVRIANDNYAN